jgi:hypothetical protein
MRRRRREERKIFFPWEKRSTRLAWLSRRHARTAALVALGALVAWAFAQVAGRRRAVFATRAAIATVMRAVEAYRADHEGRCPSGFAELLAPGGGHEPYLARVPRDGWGRELWMQCPGRKHPESADVRSAGPAGSFEARDQIE